MQLKYPLAFLVACLFANAFAQEESNKLAVYVQGASDASVNKLLGSKLLSALSRGGDYADVVDPGAFQDDIANAAKGGAAQMAQIIQAAKRHGADYVCAVNMLEAFGAYSISARIVKVSDLQVVKTGSADRSLKSLDDLTAVSNELASQLLPDALPYAPPQSPENPFASSGSFGEYPWQQGTTLLPPPPAAVAEASEQCARTYNINELVFKLKDGFPRKLKDCASKLEKSMKFTASSTFMRQCAVDGTYITFSFPDSDKFIGILDNFVQNITNSAFSGGALDKKKLKSAIGSMDINVLLNDVKKLAFSNKCIVNEPYDPPDAYVDRYAEYEEEEDDDESKSAMSFGIRAGLNFSIASADEYAGVGSGIMGLRLGFVLDIAATNWLHIQPGLMYIQKSMGYYDSYYYDYEEFTAHFLDLPVLMSFPVLGKLFPKLRNANPYLGPYVGVCLSGRYCNIDTGLSIGFGYSIGMFYIGGFVDTSFLKVSDSYGFNLGINL